MARPRRSGISYSDVPHEPPWLPSLQAPAVVATNLLVSAALFVPFKTARVRWVRPLEDVIAGAQASGRPIIYYSWHAYEPFLLLAFRDMAAELIPRAIGHDGFRSRLLQRATAGFGFPVWVYRRRSPVSPTSQIIRMLQEDKAIVSLVADAGGTPRAVRPGFVEVARTVRAFLVPIVVRAPHRLRIQRPWRYGLPLPFGRVELHAGDPLDGSTVTSESCRRAMEEMESLR